MAITKKKTDLAGVGIALIGPNNNIVAFKRTEKAHDSFKTAWLQSCKNARRLRPADWTYEDVKREMLRFGFEVINHDLIRGE